MFQDLLELFKLTVDVFHKGGWVVFLIGLAYAVYKLYMDKINMRWYNEQKWLFLKVSVPPENELSPLTFEHIFNQLHSIQNSRTWAEKYLEGQFQIWFTWEVTSIGGVIGYHVRILEKHRDTLEAAIFSQFPEAEINETADYFETLPKYDPETSEYDIFAMSFVLNKPDPYPIRTYHDFEHSSTDTFIDPFSGILEELGKISVHEMYVIQYIFQPVTDDWKKSAYRLISELKGEARPKKSGFDFLDIFSKLLEPLFDVILGSSAPTEKKMEKEPPISLMLHKTEGEKDTIAAIERNISKLGYATKIRCLYLAPREKYKPGPVNSAIIGGVKSMGSSSLNSLKPQTKKWTRANYFLFKHTEAAIVRFRLNWRKVKFMKMIRTRWFFHGPKEFVLNTEEIATILHFPLTTVHVPQIEKVPVTKVQPPPELPIAT